MSNEEKEALNELEVLKSKVIELEEEIEKQKIENSKHLKIRNLKIFGNICNLVAPFIFTTGMTIGIFKGSVNAFPFHIDKIVNYKEYDLEFETDGDVTVVSEYRRERIFGLPASSLVIYTPWELQDGKYVRFKREFNLEEGTLDLYYAVLKEDYDFLFRTLGDYKEERQETNRVDLSKGNNYFCKASLHIKDDEDILQYDETKLRNIVLTIIQVALSLGVGGFLAYFRKDFDFLYEMENVKEDYNSKLLSLECKMEELENIKEMIFEVKVKINERKR